VTFDLALHVFHVAAAAVALVLGIVAMSAPKRPVLHPRVGEAYFIAVTAVCTSASLLAVLHWTRAWFFLPVALVTWAFAVLGYMAAKRRWPGWLVAHVGGQCSSYTGMVIAFVVNNWKLVTGVPGIQSPPALLIPGFVGSVAVLWIMNQVYLGKRPRL
jgi:uncharacterized membrane protein